MHLCRKCVKDTTLKSLMRLTQIPQSCVLCGHSRMRTAPVELRRTKEVLRSVLRYHFDEAQYNRHLGGDEIEYLLCRDNPIIRHENSDAIADICLEAFSGGYETEQLGVSLFAGHHDGHQLRPLSALANAEHDLISETRRRLETENHFALAPAMAERLNELRPHFENQVSGQFVRARTGFDSSAVHVASGLNTFVPHSSRGIGAPPPPLAAAGRINRAGVAFLYVASNVETAVAEVRPHPGHFVSTGVFELRTAVTVADFTRVTLDDFTRSDTRLEQFTFLRSLARTRLRDANHS